MRQHENLRPNLLVKSSAVTMDESFKLFIDSKSNNVENPMKLHKYGNSQTNSTVTIDVCYSDEQITEDRLKSKVSSTLQVPEQLSDMAKEAATEMYFHNLAETGKIIDSMYEKLSREGKTNVDGVVKFLKDSTIIDVLHTKEDQVRLLLSGVKDGKLNRNQFKDLMLNLGRSNDANISFPSHHLSFSESSTNTRALTQEQEATQKCYFTLLCKIANIIDGKWAKLVQDGKASITEIIRFLQDTSIMDALEDKRLELLGRPISKRHRSSVVICSSISQQEIQGVKDKVLKPSPEMPKINSPATSTAGKSDSKGALRESTSGSRLSEEKDKKRRASNLSGQRSRTGVKGGPKPKR